MKKNVTIMVDVSELAVRMMEAHYGKRPDGFTAGQILAAQDEDVRERWIRTAETAIAFVMQSIQDGTGGEISSTMHELHRGGVQ